MSIDALRAAHANYLTRAYGPGGAVTPDEPAVSQGRVIKDQVEISAGAQKIGGLLKGFPRLEFIGSREELEARTSEFQKTLSKKFRAAGIDTSRPIDLVTDRSGHVRVVGDHPDKAKIEAMLDADADLSNEFRLLSSMASLLRAAEEHQKFAEAYAKNPAAALAQFAYLFEDHHPQQATFRYTDSGMTTYFSDTPGITAA